MCTAYSSFFDWVANPLLFPFLRSTKLEQGHFTVAAESRPVWSRRLQSLETELSQKHSGYKEAARSLLTLLLVDAARLATEISGQVPIEEQPILAKVFAFIESQYAKPISTIDVAKSLGRSSGYLTTFVRRLTGRTVLQWIIERRMAEARRLLLETDENIAVISERLSYSEPTHFIRQFRNSHRITPDAWRRANR